MATKDVLKLKSLEFKVFQFIQNELKNCEVSTSNVTIETITKRAQIPQADVVRSVVHLRNKFVIEVDFEDDEIDVLAFIYLNEKKLKKMEVVEEQDPELRNQLNKKYTKYTTSQLQIKYPTLTGIDQEVCRDLLQKRGVPIVGTPSCPKAGAYVNPDNAFGSEEELAQTEKEYAKLTKVSKSTAKTEKKPVEKKDVTGEVKPGKRKVLTPEEEEFLSLKRVELPDRKQLVVACMEFGIPKQALEKVQPPIASWSYIYDIYRQHGK